MLKAVILFFFFLIVSNKQVLSSKLQNADSHGPISLGADHTHSIGEVMFSYKFGSMKMYDTVNGNNYLSADEILKSPNGASDSSGTYMNAPIKMQMEKHMFGAMYAPTQKITLMAMIDYQLKKMKQKRMPMAGGTLFEVNSEGIGDLKVGSLFKLVDKKKLKIHYGLGISIPTGSIDERGATPASNSARLGYGMQNGTGTNDFFFLTNGIYNINKIKLGSQIYYKKHLGSVNKNKYKYGDHFRLNLWVSYRYFINLSQSLKLVYEKKNEMIGSDNEMNPRMSPVLDFGNHGSQKIILGTGINFVNHSKFLKNNRLALEILKPIYYNLKGIQMTESYKFILGWQYGF